MCFAVARRRAAPTGVSIRGGRRDGRRSRSPAVSECSVSIAESPGYIEFSLVCTESMLSCDIWALWQNSWCYGPLNRRLRRMDSYGRVLDVVRRSSPPDTAEMTNRLIVGCSLSEVGSVPETYNIESLLSGLELVIADSKLSRGDRASGVPAGPLAPAFEWVLLIQRREVHD